jgi:hypothetical protein
MRRTAIAAAMTLIAATTAACFPSALAAGGAWTFVIDRQDQPDLVYSENGNTAFSLGCGISFALYANYPGPANRTGDVSITIGNGATSMVLKGSIVTPAVNIALDKDGFTVSTPKAGDAVPAQFVQWNLGFNRTEPEEGGKQSQILEDRLLDMLDSKKPLTISAENKSYVLPAVDAPNWKARFKKIC